MRSRLPPLTFLIALAAGAALHGTGAEAASPPDPPCVAPGQWRAADGTHPAPPSLIRTLAAKAVVLLGESHTSRDDHRWQLQTLAALHAHNPNMVIGFEAFPRSVQPVLDRWIRGELSEPAFLKAARWHEVWRFDPDLYMDLFHFARINRIPMVAMNVENALIRAVRAQGWSAIPLDAREGVSTPAPATPGYLEILKAVYDEHAPKKRHGAAPLPPEGQKAPAAPAIADGVDADGFARFAEAQVTWDRAMAEALARARGGAPGTVVVGIVGRGHLEYGFGIPRQLADLGVKETAVLLPWQPDRPCADLARPDGTPLADAVFALADLPDAPGTPKPRLGVFIEPAPPGGPAGIRVRDVVAGSVAEAAGINAGDILQRAAGTTLSGTESLIAIVQAQAPGTWLPLAVARGGAVLELVAKFPPAPAPGAGDRKAP